MNSKLKLIWAMMLFSSLFYAGLAYLLSSGLIPFEFPDAEDAGIFSMVLGMVSAVSLALAYILPSRLTQWPVQNVAILRMTFVEAVGIFGLIYVLQTGDFNRGLFFFATSFLGLFVVFPKEENQSH